MDKIKVWMLGLGVAGMAAGIGVGVSDRLRAEGDRPYVVGFAVTNLSGGALVGTEPGSEYIYESDSFVLLSDGSVWKRPNATSPRSLEPIREKWGALGPASWDGVLPK